MRDVTMKKLNLEMAIKDDSIKALSRSYEELKNGMDLLKTENCNLTVEVDVLKPCDNEFRRHMNETIDRLQKEI